MLVSHSNRQPSLPNLHCLTTVKQSEFSRDSIQQPGGFALCGLRGTRARWERRWSNNYTIIYIKSVILCGAKRDIKKICDDNKWLLILWLAIGGRYKESEWNTHTQMMGILAAGSMNYQWSHHVKHVLGEFSHELRFVVILLFVTSIKRYHQR
jgi:hypothetical protein